ncbi:MAG TPA: phenylacetic acid degradation protein [Lachnospiraceae bacterium]|nr:phenylacetic acid degradation protein [Lachnospiraceae bacterium]
MATFKSLEEAREHFKNDRFASLAGASIDEMTDNTAVCSMTLSDVHKNAYGGVMGGAIFTLADLAFAVVANQIHSLSVASQVSINYLSAPKGSKLIAKAKSIKEGRTTTVITVEVYDDNDRYIALFTGTAFKL